MRLPKILILLFIIMFYNQILCAQCTDNGHSINAADSWLSCEKSTIPNSIEPANYHWIHYDLGYSYKIGILQVWNYNVENETQQGIKDGEIFYSEDGQNWISNGIIQVPEASGQNDYEGWEGINLSGKVARYIMLIAYSNWENSDCIGMSEIRFDIAGPITSLKDKILESTTLNVFPNPADHVLNIELADKQSIQELIIFDNTGHEILRRRGNQTDWNIDIYNFSAGMYYLKIWTKEQQYLTSKFIKSNF